jgi:GT2 family glycosyltransferase
VRDLEQQVFPREDFEFVVIVGSNDEIFPKVKEIIDAAEINIRFVRRPNIGVAAARSLGIQEATGEWVGFVSDDCRVPPDWLQSAGDHIDANPKICGIEGALTTDIDSPFYHVAVNQKGEYSKKYVGYLTANMFYRRDVLVQVGGFDETLPTKHPLREDTDVAIKVLKLGRVPYCNEVRVHHPSYPIGLKGAIKNELRHESDPFLYKKHPQEYAYIFPKTNIVWLLLIIGQLLGVLGFLSSIQPFGLNLFGISVLGFNIYWVISIISTLLFFVAGKGLKMGIYRWIGSYVRFYAFLKGSIKAKTWFPFLRLTLKAFAIKPEKTDII